MFQETLKELYPSWEAVKDRHREVILFTSGLMKDPKPLINYLYEMQIEDYLNRMRTGDDAPSIDADLFRLFYTEATVKWSDHPLHNEFVNYYDDEEDDRMKRPRDTTPIYFPSRVYHLHAGSSCVGESSLSGNTNTKLRHVHVGP